jgi:hypothetical protein
MVRAPKWLFQAGGAILSYREQPIRHAARFFIY